MKISFTSILVLALATEGTLASTWFSKPAYNKWHETELERWLSDYNVPYPSAADRKELETLVKSNWQTKIGTPYHDWDTPQLQHYLKSKGHQAKKGAESNKQTLIGHVKSYWTDPVDTASESYHSIKDWFFDSWTDSQLKAFLDKHGIPAPQPRKRDTLLSTVRSNYESIAKKVGETAAYPGNWLYENWAESDLKEYLDERGVPVPQPTTRDKLIASVRRHSRLASEQVKASAASASASAASAQATLGDAVFNAWSDSQIKEWADKNGIKVPQGSKRNELLALARKHRAALLGDNVASSGSSAYSSATSKGGKSISSASSVASSKGGKAYDSASSAASSQASQASSVASSKASGAYHAGTSIAGDAYDTASSKAGELYGAATTKAGNEFARATDTAAQLAENAFHSAIDTWSDSRLKAYLDARGVPVPQGGKKDELIAAVRLQKHKAATGWSAWTFDTWTTENLKKWLKTQNNKASQKAGVTRDELLQQAQVAYAEASKTGGVGFASVTSYMAKATDSAKDSTFDTWSDSDLKSYLDSYGVPVYQGSTTNELKAMARRNYNYFRYGTSTPTGTIYARLSNGAQWVLEQLRIGASRGQKEAAYQAEKAADAVKEGVTTATNRAQEAAQRAGDKIKEEL